ncbi:MAG: apolipoprotein N-acyltransferase [Bacteroidales bacterium]|nr:apolipoprotein N-acyltransferase [Bacteroidales bacterium]
MRKQGLLFAALALLFTLLMSLPWLVPHMGCTVLVGLLPLLVMERLATRNRTRRFFWWHYGSFVLWNAVTTWWVGEATVGGAVFAILANALQMSLVFGSFRWVKKRLGGVLPYLYLAAAWIAWERFYLTSAQITWPWLVLGNAFADTTSLIQWYSVTGHLGGSLWVWTANLSLFGGMVALSDGSLSRWNVKARVAALAGIVVAFFGPMIWSACLRFHEEGAPLEVVIGQPNLDPYQKFESLSQEEQDARFLAQLEKAEWPTDSSRVLVLGPETLTPLIFTDEVAEDSSFRRYQNFLQGHPSARLLFGASTYDRSPSALDPCSFVVANNQYWLTEHNSAILMDAAGHYDLYHKSKLVVGVESTPYPRFFIPLENFLGGSLMGKDVGQKEIACLSLGGDTPNDAIKVGAAVCYESVFGDFCAGYVRKGANLLAVITNDAWWGDTPGYGQHLNYSRLRAIETRRWVARCGNTGISAIIDPCGRIVKRSPWWEEAVLQGQVQLLEGESFFVRHGDITGRAAVLLFLLLGAAALVRSFTSKKRFISKNK